MPGINGVDTFKEIKAVSASIKVIMMTAYSVEDLVREALEEGAYGLIYKPLDIDKVLSLIEKAKKGIFVLVVDDDPATCETLKDVLMEKSYKVGMAQSGEEAISLTKENNIDIVFIDVKMPVLNGLETYRRIKKINPKIIAVMMTGYRQEVKDLVEESLRCTAYTCLYKPLHADKVIGLIEQISRQKREGTLRKPGHGGD
jgi:DNA-binding NtrC family response regulator